MGGKNVIMIMDDANLELAVEGCLWGGFGTSGQRCTAASRVVVHEKVYQAFLEQFVARAKALRVGDGLDPATQMGPSVSRGQLETVMKYVEIGTQEGARLACGGHALDERRATPTGSSTSRRSSPTWRRRCASRRRRSSGRSCR